MRLKLVKKQTNTEFDDYFTGLDKAANYTI